MVLGVSPLARIVQQRCQIQQSRMRQFSQYQPEPAPRSGPPPAKKDSGPPPARRSNRESVTEAAMKSIARNVAGSLGREIVRGILGSLRR